MKPERTEEEDDHVDIIVSNIAGWLLHPVISLFLYLLLFAFLLVVLGLDQEIYYGVTCRH